jgi:hypothetical protein
MVPNLSCKTNLTVRIRKSNLKGNIMSFVNAVKNANNSKPARTANGMKANATSKSKVLDLFGVIGSARGSDISKQFVASMTENLDLTVRMLLWARDIRGGAGERATFRNLLVEVEKTDPVLAARLMHKVPELGRWDDLFAYRDPLNRQKAFAFIREALANQDGLCAKWMPRKGPVAVELTKFLELTPKQYRKLIVGLTNVVESKMCAKEWEAINFSHVPSVASARYQKAFGRNAKEAYSAYIAELKKPVAERADPKVKINAGAVYPYDVVKSVVKGNAAVADEQWKALPNYIGDAKIMPMVDVSGSMGSLWYSYSQLQPIDIAVSLGLYCADKNTGDFKDLFLTFSGKPKMEHLKGTLSQKMKQMEKAHWDMNTNLHAAFDEILKVAIKGNVAEKDMPQMMLILSDMQFDQCTRYDDSAMQMIKRKYNDAGYNVPKIVFWNVSMYGKADGNTPVRFDERGTAHISGFSPAIMKSVLANDLEDFTPYNVMVKALMVDRYAY